MNDHDLLVRLDERFAAFEEQYDNDMQILKDRTTCKNHDKRLLSLEDRMKGQEGIEKVRGKRNMTIRETILAIVCAVLGGGFVVEILRSVI
ncbi:MAG: hypothetical protein PHS81_04330 [Candidatus Nanoarchaeia archaeon]|nr:hypothetical protein [Candidatus Nanoarchaeia archaeon]